MATGSISPNGANSWKPDVMAAFKTACESEGWVTQENGYNDGTYTRWVFRNGTSDFAVMFFCVTSALNTAGSSSSTVLAGGLWFTVGEEYDDSTKELFRLTPLTTSTFASAADCSTGATGYTPASLVSAGTAGPGYTGFGTYISSSAACGGSDYFWWSISANQAFIGSHHFGTSTNQRNPYFGFGIFSSLLPSPTTNDPVPIYLIGFSSIAIFGAGAGVSQDSSVTQINYGGVTRSAMNPSSPAHSYRIAVVPEINASRWQSSNTWTAYVSSNDSSLNDKYQSGQRFASRAIIVRYGSILNSAEASAYGHTRGYIDDAIFVCDEGSAIVRGDEFTIGSDTYYATGGGTFCVAVKVIP